MEIDNEWKKPIQMPIGVYFCLGFILIRFGLFQFIGYFSAIREANGEVQLPIIVVSLGLCVFTAASTIWAFIGDNLGRLAVLLFVSLNIFWSLFLGALALSDDSIDNDKAAVMYIINVVFTLLLVIACLAYLMSKQVVSYYKQNN